MSYFQDASSASSASPSSTSDICTVIPPQAYLADPINGSWTLHHIITVVGGVLAIVATILSLGLGTMHLIHYTNSAEQRQLVRALNVPAVFTIFGFFSIWFYDASPYLIPVADLYECFALVAIFYYIVAIASPDEKSRDTFFDQLELQSHGEPQPGGSLAWFQKRWTSVFQLLPGRIITTIATWIVNATLCRTSKRHSTAITIIDVVNAVQTTICIAAILQVYKALKHYLVGHYVLYKLAVFKSVVGLQFIQRVVFSGLNSHNVIKPSTHISKMDWEYGIPNFITVCEMFLFAILFIHPFSWKPYSRKNVSQDNVDIKWPFSKALLHVWNLTDIFGGVSDVFKLRNRTKRARTFPVEPEAQQQMTYQLGRRHERV